MKQNFRDFQKIIIITKFLTQKTHPFSKSPDGKNGFQDPRKTQPPRTGESIHGVERTAVSTPDGHVTQVLVSGALHRNEPKTNKRSVRNVRIRNVR